MQCTRAYNNAENNAKKCVHLIMQKSFQPVDINYTFAPVDLQATSNLVKVVKIMIAESNLFARTWKLGEQQALSNQNTSQIE